MVYLLISHSILCAQPQKGTLRRRVAAEAEVPAMIYLDYAASCPLFPQAAEEWKRCALEDFANPGGLHRASGQARALLHRSRKTLSSLLHVPDRSVFFCSGGTEANNWAVRCGAGSAPGHLLIGACEHKSVLESAQAMEAAGFSVRVSLKGLGEYPAFQKLYVKRLQEWDF